VRDLDPKTLRLLVAVCDCGSMTRAAEQEGIEASAISKRIAQLEDELGIELLVRGRRGVEATAAGVALVEKAREVLFTMDRMVADAGSFASGRRGHVRVLATAAAIAEALLDDVAAFMREPEHENIRIEIEERVAADLVREVRDGTASLGVCDGEAASAGLVRRPYRRDRLALAVYAGHALAGRAAIRFEDTLAFDHVGLPPATAVHLLLQRAAAASARTVSYRVVVSTFDAALRAVAANLGVAVVPAELAVRAVAAVEIAVVPLEDAWAERRLVVCCREVESLAPPSRRLLAHLEARATAATSVP
jgi:DNA-binding transcriptional LysR family regulator